MDLLSTYQVTTPIQLQQISCESELNLSTKKAISKLERVSERLGKFQDLLYAHNRYSVLIIIQGMDTAGKDSLIREVFKNFNARGVNVQSFKAPCANELEHDYLYRHYLALPEKGKFTVFNRSQYENVLVSRVHPQIVLNERLPHVLSLDQITPEFWEKRYQEIVNFENHQVNNGVIVLKFFLHLSKQEQKKRIIRRLDKPKHQYKFTASDVHERQYWDKYQGYYQTAINKTSTPQCPWFIVPADNKEIARLLLAQILEQKLKQYTDVSLPILSDKTKQELLQYKAKLMNNEIL